MEIIRICKDAGIITLTLEAANKNIGAARDVSARNRRPKPSKKVSLKHIKEEFNKEVQIDFTFHGIQNEKQIVLVMTETGTGYTERKIVSERYTKTIIESVEKMWFYRHGMPQKISADDEFNKTLFLKFLQAHNVEFMTRPVRIHNKLGIAERNDGILKTIVNKISMDNTNGTIEQIISGTTFMSNMFSGSLLLSSFQLAKGYKPLFLGVLRSL